MIQRNLKSCHLRSVSILCVQQYVLEKKKKAKRNKTRDHRMLKLHLHSIMIQIGRHVKKTLMLIFSSV